MPVDATTRITRNSDLGHGNFLLEFVEETIARDVAPGQFFMIGIPGADVLLRRPFSVCGLPGTFEDAPEGGLEVLYRVVGRGTERLASLGPGAPITVLGPLGRGFDAASAGPAPVIVAGGIGSAPFPALVSVLASRGARPVLLYGARTAGDLPLLDWFRERCAETVVTTEDGSAGRRALVTEPLAERLADPWPEGSRLYACGPTPMLREVARLAVGAGVPCELSLEAHMACGFGVCLGCVVPTRGGPGGPALERVCVEGPVMPAERLAW